MADKMRICPDCGREWSDKVIFCMGCGARTVLKTSEFTEFAKSSKEIYEPVVKPVEGIEKSKNEIVYEEKDNKTETIFRESKRLPVQENVPDIEDLILAYIRKALKDQESKLFIEHVRELVNK